MDNALEVSAPAVDSNSNQKGESNMETAIEVQAVPEVQLAPVVNSRSFVYEPEVKWAEAGKQFRGQLDNAQWQIGDWLVLGEKRYPQKKALLAEAAKITGEEQRQMYTTFHAASAFP